MQLKSKGIGRELLTPTFIYLWLIMFLVELVKSALLVTILPVYMGSVLQLSAFAIGLALSLQYIGDNFSRGPAGWIVERIGFRATMLSGLVISAGAVAMIAWTKQAGFIALASTLLGIGTAPLWPCVLIGISDISSRNQNFGTAMGVIQMSTLGGTGAGPVVINFFVDKSYSLVFWILLGCLAVTIALAVLLPGMSKDAAKADRQVGRLPKKGNLLLVGGIKKLGANLKHTFIEIRNNLHVSPLLYPALFLQSFAVGLLTPVITLYIRTVLGLSPGAFSSMLIVGGGITALGLIPVGKMVDKFGTKMFLHAGFLTAFLSILGLALFREITMVWVLVIGLGVSYSLILPSWDTKIAQYLPEGEKGTVWGLFLTVQGCGMVIGPIVSGKLWDMLGPSAPFVASAISMGTLFFLHLWLSRPQTEFAGKPHKA
ncbi:MFS transporter [Paenibacillus caui]|uniref:MFS transporter n=1 Tax=Paenibacillus caui TaxID=2873927 RepID=UPI001CA95AB8|nr:MFS transporter [Paenibacillus caui]